MSELGGLRTASADVWRRMEKDVSVLDRAVDDYRNERAAALNRQLAAEDRYERELKSIAAVEDVDHALGQMEEELQHVDHNIMRHLYYTLQSDSYGDTFDEVSESPEDQGYLDEQQQMAAKPRRRASTSIVVESARREPPSAEVKQEMREALFGYLDAAREDEDELEKVYEAAKEAGDMRVTEAAADRLFGTQKANLTALLKMIKEYRPHSSGHAWGKDADFVELVREFRL